MVSSTSDGTATASSGDYTPSSGCETVPAGVKASGVILIPLLDDNNAEPTETLSVTAYIWPLGPSHTAKGTIAANNT